MRIECAGVLFDMDGTLVDSTAIVERAWGSWAKRHNLEFAEVLAFSHGRPTTDTLEHFLPGFDFSGELAELQQYEETEREGLVPVQGAAAAVMAVQAGKWAVVTSATRRLAEIRLTAAGLILPPVLVTADRIRQGKPHPEGFLCAARELDISVADCLVFEDSGAGIEAGIRAGMQVIGLRTTLPREQLGCKWTVDDFRGVRFQKCGSGFEVRFTPAF